MKDQINVLRKLQEFILTRDEHHQTGDGSHLDSLNDSISELQKKLSPLALGLFERLYKKNHVFISEMNNGCCSGCGMQVPIAQGQQVRMEQHLITCSSCGRILFAADDAAAHNVSAPGDRDDPKTGISRFSGPELMLVDLGSVSRSKAIEKLAKAMEDGNYIKNSESLVTAALEREAVLSTAVGACLAFPHVRGVEGGGLTLAMGVSKKGINWDGEVVNLVFLSAIPVAVSAFYLRLMSGISQSFSKESNRTLAMEAKDSAALWKVLCKATRTTVK